MFAGLRLSIGLLTIFPVTPPADLTPRTARSAMLLAPVAVLPLALGVALLGAGASWLRLPAVLAAALVVAALAWGTRAMHLDGLADTVDGLGSGGDRERALAIMKGGDIGPMGVVALVLVLLMQVLAASVLLTRPWGWLQLAILLVLSRAALAFGCMAGVPSARPSGLGALVAGSVAVPAAVASWVGWSAVAAVVAEFRGQPLWWSLAGAVVALIPVWWLLRRAIRRFGGITGDVLGALVETAATVLLLVACID